MLSLILVTPFLSALVLLILGNVFSFRIKLENVVSYVISCIPAGLCAVIGVWTWFTHLENQNFSLPGFYWFKWFNSEIFWEQNVSSLTVNMLLLVNLVGFVVLAFSPVYMYEERNITTFFAYVYLFIGFMNLLLFSNNLLQLFVGWEGIGICSFLLIGFWGGRFSASKAAFYAMLINKIGDITLLLGAVLFIFNTSQYSFEYTSNGIVNTIYETEGTHYQKVIFGLLLVSTFCKSAQILFHGWLPEAMEGPTPVSALIHAATMVTAGNYLVVKLSSNWVHSAAESYILIGFGAFTCLYASIVAFYQVDIKRVVAYSTCSQLGYMVLACGLSMYEESLTHCLGHGFFKALLFLASGWVIYVYGHEQSSSKMGGRGLFSMELVFFVVGSGSLVALPLTSGWYSKEAIIFGCVNKNICMMLGFAVWMAAILTSLYSVKVIYSVFFSGAKESGIGGENLGVTSLESRNRWIRWFIFAIAVSLFLLVNFSLFFGYLNSARNLELHSNHANLTSIEIFNLCVYFFLVGCVLRVLESLFQLHKVLRIFEVCELAKATCKKIRNLKKKRKEAMKEWHENKMTRVREIRLSHCKNSEKLPEVWIVELWSKEWIRAKYIYLREFLSEHWYYLPSYVKLLRLWLFEVKTFFFKLLSNTGEFFDRQTEHRNPNLYYTGVPIRLIIWSNIAYVIGRAFPWSLISTYLPLSMVYYFIFNHSRLCYRTNKKRVLRLAKICLIPLVFFQLDLFFLLPVCFFLLSYKVCTLQAIIGFSKALHFAHIKAKFWNYSVVLASWYNERFEPGCYVLIHTVLETKLNLVKKLSKFLRNNISGWALLAFLMIFLILSIA